MYSLTFKFEQKDACRRCIRVGRENGGENAYWLMSSLYLIFLQFLIDDLYFVIDPIDGAGDAGYIAGFWVDLFLYITYIVGYAVYERLLDADGGAYAFGQIIYAIGKGRQFVILPQRYARGQVAGCHIREELLHAEYRAGDPVG